MMPVGYAYPTVSTTPSIPIGDASPRDFHVFRVDFVELHHVSHPEDSDRCTFQELDLSARKEIPRQTSVGFAYWMALYAIPSAGEQFRGSERSYDKWVHVRIYRRGYKTIEISPSTSEKSLKWELARSDEDREEAIDQLIGIEKNSLRHLEPGSRSPKHEAFLRFAAREYNDLARSIDEQNLDQIGLRTRMFDKAVRLRGLAME